MKEIKHHDRKMQCFYRHSQVAIILKAHETGLRIKSAEDAE